MQPPKEHQYAETLTAPPETDAPPLSTSGFDNGSLVAGKYRIERQIAEGGNGIVVAAMHLALQQPVAIKYLKPGPRSNRTAVERFEREGRLAARITSEHVVRVSDVGELPDGAPFMVMELLKGRDLGKVLSESGPLPIPRAVDYVLQACDALSQAHALEIVHRDIKPENLILADRPSNTPIVKVIDFGISKAAPSRDGKWAYETSKTDRFGTPAYMSPEQLRSSAEVDARADIWAIGVLLHELLTQTLPFQGDDFAQLCSSILMSPPVKLTAVRPGAPLALEAVILKCLEKSAAHRFRNVAELAQELAPFGPPLAAERAARIREVLRASGMSIRPAPPQPGSMDLAVIRDLLPPSSLDMNDQVVPAFRRRGMSVVMVVAALGMLVAAAGFAIPRSGLSARWFSPPAAPAVPARVPLPQVAPAPPASAVSAVLAPPPVSIAPAASEIPTLNVTQLKRTAKASAPSSGYGALGAAYRPAPPKAAVSPAPKPQPEPSPANDPRSLFGERK